VSRRERPPLHQSRCGAELRQDGVSLAKIVLQMNIGWERRRECCNGRQRDILSTENCRRSLARFVSRAFFIPQSSCRVIYVQQSLSNWPSSSDVIFLLRFHRITCMKSTGSLGSTPTSFRQTYPCVSIDLQRINGLWVKK